MGPDHPDRSQGFFISDWNENQRQEDQKKNGEEVDIDNGDAITNEARENYRAPEK